MDKNDIEKKMESIGESIFELGFEVEGIESDETLQEIYNRIDQIEIRCKEVFDFALAASDEEHFDDLAQEDYLPTKREEYK